MIITDYYRGEKLPDTGAKYRYDITSSAGEVDFLESILINKRDPNSGGLSFNLVPRPRWNGSRQPDMAICKGSQNLSSVYFPDVEAPFAYGDINHTGDALLIVYNSDFKEIGITTVELFVARGQKPNKKNIWILAVDGELSGELDNLRAQSVGRLQKR
jgi:hypothetical protein